MIGIMKTKLACAVLGLSVIAAAPVSAASLDDIMANGKIVIGVQNDLPPYSLIDENNEPVGYDIEVAQQLAERLGVELELVVLTPANRVPYLISNRVDAVVATIGITPERRKAIGFTRPYLVFQTVMVAPKDNPVTSHDTIGNSVVGLTRGTAHDAMMNDAPEGTRIMRFDDDATTITALVTGQVDMMPNGVPIVTEIIKRHPERNLEIKYVMANTYAGVGVNIDNVELIERLNELITEMEADGTLGASFIEWIGTEMPDLPKSLAELP